MRRSAPRLVAGFAAAGLLLSGCGGSPEPSPLPKPSESSSPSASTPTPPVMPAAAQEQTKAGVTAFVSHYVDVLNYATFTGETAEARALDSGKCVSCDRMLGSIETIYEKGGRVEGGAWKPAPASDVPHPGRKGWTVDVNITYGPQTVVREEGASPQEYTGGGRLVSFILRRTPGGGWKVSEWTRAS